MGLLDGLLGGTSGPSPKKLIAQQQAANDAAFKQGLISTSGPFGSAQFSQNPDGTTSLNTNLSPGQQEIFDPAQAAAANFANQLPQSPFSMADVPQGMDLANAFFNQQIGLLQPGFDDRNRDLEVRAAERGLPIGSEAFSALMDPEARAQSLARQQAAQQAVLLTPQEQQRQLANALLIRGLPFQEAQGALSLQNQVQQPQTINPLGAPQAVDVANIFQNDQLIQAQQNGALGSILGAGAGLAFAPYNAAGSTLAGKLLG